MEIVIRWKMGLLGCLCAKVDTKSIKCGIWRSILLAFWKVYFLVISAKKVVSANQYGSGRCAVCAFDLKWQTVKIIKPARNLGKIKSFQDDHTGFQQG